MAYSLTSANSVIILGVYNLLPPQQIQGYAADDIFTSEAIDNAETSMGLDGKFSAGWVPVPVSVTFMLQANSDSISFFEALYSSEQQIRGKYQIFGTIVIPELGRSYTGDKGFCATTSRWRTLQRFCNPARSVLILAAWFLCRCPNGAARKGCCDYG